MLCLGFYIFKVTRTRKFSNTEQGKKFWLNHYGLQKHCSVIWIMASKILVIDSSVAKRCL